jgi:hypothetical protein
MDDDIEDYTDPRGFKLTKAYKKLKMEIDVNYFSYS